MSKKEMDSGRQKGRTRIYLRGPNYWIYYRHAGRTFQYSLKTQDAFTARKIQKQMEATLLTDGLSVRIDVPTSACVDRFMRRLEVTNRRPKTIGQYDWAFRRFFGIVARDTIGEFRPEDAETFKERGQASGLCPRSVNSVLCHVRTLFERAEIDGLIDKNPFRRVPMLKVERKIPVFVPRADVERLLEFLKDHPPYDLVATLGALCGFRKGEISAALWEWFDFERRTVTLSSRSDFTLKDYDARTVPLSTWALSILEPQKKTRGYVIRFDGMKRAGPAAEYKRRWPKLVEAAGLPGVTIKQLRSTFGSLYLQEGVSMSKIALWLGHSSEDVTRRHYATLTAYDADIEKVGK